MNSTSKRRTVAMVAAGALLALGVGAIAVVSSEDDRDATAAPTLPAPEDATPQEVALPATDPEPVADEDAERATAPTGDAAPATVEKKKPRKRKTQPATTPAPTTTGPPLDPIDPPLDTRGWEESTLLGGISIPKLGVATNLYEGIRLTTLDQGPGHWPGTAMPGQNGNVVVAAHRTSHGGPFRYIDTLVPGDEVFFETEAGQTRYVVTGSEIVPPTALWVVDQTEDATATLFACHPPGSVAERIVVYLDLAVD